MPHRGVPNEAIGSPLIGGDIRVELVGYPFGVPEREVFRVVVVWYVSSTYRATRYRVGPGLIPPYL